MRSSTLTRVCSPVDMSLRVTESCSISFSPTMTAYLALADDANFSASAPWPSSCP